jgi:hypothetical protein
MSGDIRRIGRLKANLDLVIDPRLGFPPSRKAADDPNLSARASDTNPKPGVAVRFNRITVHGNEYRNPMGLRSADECLDSCVIVVLWLQVFWNWPDPCQATIGQKLTPSRNAAVQRCLTASGEPRGGSDRM